MLFKKLFKGLIFATLFLLTSKSVTADDNYLRVSLQESWNYEAPYEQNCKLDDDWWHIFADPTLDSLIVEGQRANFDVVAAIKRIDAARAQIGVARSGYMPTVELSAGWQKSRTSGLTAGRKGAAATIDYFNVSADASWQLDLFGKISAGVNQKKAAWRASKAQYDAVMVSVAAEIATNYINFRVAQAELSVAKEHSESQLQVVKIAEVRHETGLASALDVAQAKTIYYSTMSTIPVLENEMHSYLNAIACLLGVYPENLPAAVNFAAPLPHYETLVCAGVPADLLRRRPDIIEAEANIAAAAAAVGIAKKDFLPTLAINGTIGTQAHNTGDLFKRQSIGYTIAPTLTWTVFTGLERRYALTAAKANLEALIESYNSTVLNAVAETDNALCAYQKNIDAINWLDSAREQSHKALKLSIDLYKSGNSGFTNVADAQISELTYTNQLYSAKGSAALALVNLYKALGGGWQN